VPRPRLLPAQQSGGGGVWFPLRGGVSFGQSRTMTKQTHDHARPPRDTSSTTMTRHVYIVNTTTRALLEPSLLFGPCQIGISPEYAPYQKPRARSGFDNADVGPSLSHVSLYHTKLLSRTYLYDFVCNVTRFTHLITSQGPGRGLRGGGRRGWCEEWARTGAIPE